MENTDPHRIAALAVRACIARCIKWAAIELEREGRESAKHAVELRKRAKETGWV